MFIIFTLKTLTLFLTLPFYTQISQIVSILSCNPSSPIRNTVHTYSVSPTDPLEITTYSFPPIPVPSSRVSRLPFSNRLEHSLVTLSNTSPRPHPQQSVSHQALSVLPTNFLKFIHLYPFTTAIQRSHGHHQLSPELFVKVAF